MSHGHHLVYYSKGVFRGKKPFLLGKMSPEWYHYVVLISSVSFGPGDHACL